MSTTTSGSSNASMDVAKEVSPSGRLLQNWWLIFQVFVAGAATLAVEMAASRLLAPYFGTSLFVWADLIGLILLYLSVGYSIGGRLADRYPRPVVFYALTVAAALLLALIPVIARSVLNWSQLSFADQPFGILFGSLVALILLFALPMILLGCVSPFAIRLHVEQIGRAGRTAGMLYAISTAGSIVGTFLPVLVFMPNIGTALTIQAFAGLLLITSLIGIILTLVEKTHLK